MAVVSGNDFSDLAERLAELEDIPSRVTSAVAEGINDQIQEQFAAGQDPYGNAWAPLLPSTVRRKRGDRRILQRTDALASETIARPTSGSGIEISSLPYGGVHQNGDGSRMVARPLLPDGAELPERWTEIIEKETDKAFAKVLK